MKWVLPCSYVILECLMLFYNSVILNKQFQDTWGKKKHSTTEVHQVEPKFYLALFHTLFQNNSNNDWLSWRDLWPILTSGD